MFRNIKNNSLSDIEDYSMIRVKMNADEKLATFLINLSSRMKQKNWKETDFNLNMLRQDIANYLGIVVETVSRLFAQFQVNGILSVSKRNIVITNMVALKKIIGDCGVNT